MPGIKYQKPRPIKENRANAGAIALPAAGYVLNQLIGSTALPALSGASLAATLPVAGVLAGPTYGLYQTLTGQHTQGTQLTPEQVMSKSYVNDATFVARPRFLDLEEEKSADTENTTTEENTTEENKTTSADTSSQNSEPKGKKSLRQKLADRIAGKPKPKKPTDPEEQTSFNKALKVARKVLIETKGNNFGPNYQWRNAARIPLYYKFGPYAIGYGSEIIPEGFYHIGESFEEGRQAGRKSNIDKDTTQVTKQKPKQNEPDSILQYTPPTPITRYTQQQIDSINNLYDNYID